MDDQMWIVYIKDVDGGAAQYSGLCSEIIADKFLEKIRARGEQGWKQKAKRPGESDVTVNGRLLP